MLPPATGAPSVFRVCVAGRPRALYPRLHHRTQHPRRFTQGSTTGHRRELLLRRTHVQDRRCTLSELVRTAQCVRRAAGGTTMRHGRTQAHALPKAPSSRACLWLRCAPVALAPWMPVADANVPLTGVRTQPRQGCTRPNGPPSSRATLRSPPRSWTLCAVYSSRRPVACIYVALLSITFIFSFIFRKVIENK